MGRVETALYRTAGCFFLLNTCSTNKNSTMLLQKNLLLITKTTKGGNGLTYVPDGAAPVEGRLCGSLGLAPSL